ncbi:hypothetical protein D3C74_330740 [compost metagenome]
MTGSLPLRSGEVAVSALFETCFGEQFFHDDLIHSGCGSEHPRSDVRQIGHFEEPLDGSIFAVRSMQKWKYHVNVGLTRRKLAEQEPHCG